MPARPRLKPYARPVLRTARGLRLGTHPELGVLIEGVSDAEAELLTALDGQLDMGQVYRRAARTGVPASRVDHLLDELRSRLLLVEQPSNRLVLAKLGTATPGRAIPSSLMAAADALAAAYASRGDGMQEVAARADRAVVLDGAGSFPRMLALLLAAAGVGRVRQLDHPRTTRAVVPLPDDLDQPDLVILLARAAVSPVRASRWRGVGTAVLPVVLHDHRAVVGPTAVQGHPPCLRCLDLHRRDRDPSWPMVLAQLDPASGERLEVEPALGSLTGGVAGMVALTYLDDRPLPAGISLEMGWPWPAITGRRWSPHPSCGCADTAST